MQSALLHLSFLCNNCGNIDFITAFVTKRSLITLQKSYSEIKSSGGSPGLATERSTVYLAAPKLTEPMSRENWRHTVAEEAMKSVEDDSLKRQQSSDRIKQPPPPDQVNPNQYSNEYQFELFFGTGNG